MRFGKSSFSLAKSDFFFRKTSWVLASIALLPLFFVAAHLVGAIDQGPLDFFWDETGRGIFVSLFVIFLCAGFPIWQPGLALVVGAALAPSLASTDAIPLWINAICCAGMVSALLLIIQIKSKRQPVIDCFIGWLPFFFLATTARPALLFSAKFVSPFTFDGVLFGWERNLFGGEVAFLFFHNLSKIYPWTRDLLNATYENLNIAVACMIGLGIRYHYRRYSLPVFFLLTGAFAALLYSLLPAVGPKWALIAAKGPVPFGLIEIPVEMARNCVPSLHFGWAFAIALMASDLPSRIWRTLAIVFCFLTGLATLSTGEHYLVDLVFAVPFILAVDLILRTDIEPPLRDRAFQIHLLVLAFWYSVSRSGLLPNLPGWITWLSIFASLFACRTALRAKNLRAVDPQPKALSETN